MDRPSTKHYNPRRRGSVKKYVLTLSSSASRFLFEGEPRSKEELPALNEDRCCATDVLGDGQGGRGGALMLAISSWSRSLMVLACERMCVVGCSDILEEVTSVGGPVGDDDAPG